MSDYRGSNMAVPAASYGTQGAGYSVAMPSDRSTLGMQLDRWRAAVAALNSANGRLQDMTDRLIGDRPQAADSCASAKQGVGGLLGENEQLLAMIDFELNRLHGLLGEIDPKI